MANYWLKWGAPIAVVLAMLYSTTFKPLLFTTFGVGREIQNITEFPYTCRRVHDPRLSACEDMWLSDATRQLFLACSDPVARTKWSPSMGLFNLSAISMTDAVIAMDIDKPKKDSFEYRVLKTPGYPGTRGEGAFHLLGLTGIDSTERIELFLVNQKPSINPANGGFLMQDLSGANGTIEHFVTGPAATAMKHVRTYGNPRVATPNNVAVANKDTFYVSNDHGTHRRGIRHTLSPFLNTGDVTHCTWPLGCHRIKGGLSFPNGLLLSKVDGYLYVPSAFYGGVGVYEPGTDEEGHAAIRQVAQIAIPYPIDNLSQDANGDIYAAVFPKGLELIRSLKDPQHHIPPSAILKITKTEEGGWEWTKILEDANGELLPASTTAVHDAKTGRLFISGVAAPFITVCDPK